MGEIMLDDRELEIPVYSPVCTFGLHVSIEPRRTCTTFPEGVPLEIWIGDNNHTSPFPDDHGIQFELSDRVSAKVARKNGLPRPAEGDVKHS